MTVDEALANAKTLKEIGLGGQAPQTAIVLAIEVRRLRKLLQECLQAILTGREIEKILNSDSKPFDELANNLIAELKLFSG